MAPLTAKAQDAGASKETDAGAPLVRSASDGGAADAPSAAPQPALAEPAVLSPAKPDLAAPDGDDGGTKKKKKKKKDLSSAPAAPTFELQTKVGTFEIRGHAFALTEYQRREAVIVDGAGRLAEAQLDSLDLLVRGVRVGLHYRDPDDWLSVVLDFRLSDKPKMKNGYIQAKGIISWRG